LGSSSNKATRMVDLPSASMIFSYSLSIVTCCPTTIDLISPGV
jgi:hypothetical protein